MDAYYQQWGMEDDGDPVVSGWWTAALFEKASFGCLAWKGDELFGAAVGHARSMKKLELGSSWKSSVVWAQEAVDKLGGEAMALLDEISICNRRLAQRAQADGDLLARGQQAVCLPPGAVRVDLPPAREQGIRCARLRREHGDDLVPGAVGRGDAPRRAVQPPCVADGRAAELINDTSQDNSSFPAAFYAAATRAATK